MFDPHKFWILPTDRYLTLSAWEEKDAELGLAKPRGRPSTHDYMRHGTLTLFAALDVLEGKVVVSTLIFQHGKAILIDVNCFLLRA